MTMINEGNDGNVARWTTTIAGFVRVVNATHTAQLCEWNDESLARALGWAAAVEATLGAAVSFPEQFDELLRGRFGHVTLPVTATRVPTTISRSDLEKATDRVCRAVLCSPWLPHHRTRNDLTSATIKALVAWQRGRSTADTSKDIPHVAGQDICERLEARRRTRAWIRVADTMSRHCGRLRVQVLDATLTIPDERSYLLRPRTLRIRQLARTVLENARAARALNADDAYLEFHRRLATQLDNGSSIVQETLVWVAVLAIDDRPTNNDSPHNELHVDLLRLIESWSTRNRRAVLRLPPWLLARLCGRSPAIALQQIVPELLATGLLLFDHTELHARLGAMALQSAELAAAVDDALGALAPIVRSEVLRRSDQISTNT